MAKLVHCYAICANSKLEKTINPILNKHFFNIYFVITEQNVNAF